MLSFQTQIDNRLIHLHKTHISSFHTATIIGINQGELIPQTLPQLGHQPRVVPDNVVSMVHPWLRYPQVLDDQRLLFPGQFNVCVVTSAYIAKTKFTELKIFKRGIPCIPFVGLNPLMPNRYNCTYVLFLFLRYHCCKKSTLTLLTHKYPKHTIVSSEMNHFLYKLND